MKKYRLLKDTPTIKAGAIFKLNDNQEYECKIDRLGNSSIYIPEYVENNPDWFEEIKDSAEELAIELAINTGQFHKWEELDDSDKRYYRNEAKYIFKHFTRKVK